MRSIGVRRKPSVRRLTIVEAIATAERAEKRITINMAETLRLCLACHEWQNGHESQENCQEVLS